jgi:hypothetical protein
MELTDRPKNQGDHFEKGENPTKAVQPDEPDQDQVLARSEPFNPSGNNPFHPGDTVIYKYNQKGTVIAVQGDGVQVDFGLGVHYLSYLVLKLSQN